MLVRGERRQAADGRLQVVHVDIGEQLVQVQLGVRLGDAHRLVHLALDFGVKVLQFVGADQVGVDDLLLWVGNKK